MKNRVLRIVVYALATAAFAMLSALANLVHGEVLGGSPSRGISVGISMELVVLIHLLVNLTMALIPRALIQWGGIAVFIGATLYLLLPMHPVRAPFMAASGAMLSALAMFMCAKRSLWLW